MDEFQINVNYENIYAHYAKLECTKIYIAICKNDEVYDTYEEWDKFLFNLHLVVRILFLRKNSQWLIVFEKREKKKM